MLLGFRKLIQIIIFVVVLLIIIMGGHMTLYDFVKNKVNSITDFENKDKIKEYEEFVFEQDGNFYRFSVEKNEWLVSTNKENYYSSPSMKSLDFVAGKNQLLNSAINKNNIKIYRNWKILSEKDFNKQFVEISSKACGWSHNYYEGKREKTKKALEEELNINENTFEDELKKYNVEFREVLSIMSMETGPSYIENNPNVIGDSGKAVGLMQIWPTSAGEEVKDKLGIDYCDTKEGLSNVENNIKCGIGYIYLCKKQSKEDFEKTARCYNGGYGAINGKSACANSYADVALKYYRE